jgi:hypothetical protein
MSSDLLPTYIDNSDLRLSLLLPDVLAPGISLEDMLDYCRLYRIKGIAALFLGDPPAALLSELSKSGRAFLHFLRTTPETQKATSQALPFFDAVAATDTVCAREIAQASRPSWNAALEYEEDFLYVWFLMRHFFLDASHADSAALLERWNIVLDGSSDVRRDVCTAFLENDAGAFHAALSALLGREDAENRARAAKDGLPPELAATEASLSIEGLALLRLAEAKGLQTEADYVLVPSAARERAKIDFAPGAWREEAS